MTFGASNRVNLGDLEVTQIRRSRQQSHLVCLNDQGLCTYNSDKKQHVFASKINDPSHNST